MKNRKRWPPGFCASLAALLLAACASTPDVPANARQQQVARMRGQGAAVVTDGCLLRETGLHGYYLVNPSRRLSAIAARAAGRLLQDKEVKLTGLQVPLLCGSLSINPLTDARIADDIDGTERLANLPTALAEPVQRDAALDQAYRRLLFAARADPETLHGELFSAEQATLLRQQLHASSVLVVMLWGSSFADAASMGRAQGCLMLAVAGVCDRPADHDFDRSRALASVIDLDTRAVIWTDVQRPPGKVIARALDPAQADESADIDWLRDLTHPFFR